MMSWKDIENYLNNITMKKYFYPALSNRDYGWFRIGGPGLANCMFFAVNAYISACKSNRVGYIAPTWRKFSIGPILRKERDKRGYDSLFDDIGISGLKKAWNHLHISAVWKRRC